MASRTVQSSIIDPGLQTLTDPALQNNIRQGFGSAASSAQRLALDANGFVRDRAGVDLAGQLSSLSVGGGGYHNANETRGGGNEEFFSGLGSRNAGRRDDLPPNQGGKYSGFGSTSGGKGGYKDDEGDDFMAVRLACPMPPFLTFETSLITSALSQVFGDEPSLSGSPAAIKKTTTAPNAPVPAASKKKDDWEDFEDF
jgi:hypothetical protein